MTGTFQWWPVDGGRHAIDGELEPGDDGETFCGLAMTYTGRRRTKAEWGWPTCASCYEAARSRVRPNVFSA